MQLEGSRQFRGGDVEYVGPARRPDGGTRALPFAALLQQCDLQCAVHARFDQTERRVGTCAVVVELQDLTDRVLGLRLRHRARDVRDRHVMRS